ncbi:MAG: ATP-binding protein [Bacteroidales bacterium]|nr:ATP-binding protein [Bacteroidales bacterium]
MSKDLRAHPGHYYIKNLIAQGENQQLDFKFAINDARKIARTLVAFANTDGGKLLIGVKDNGAIAGVRSEEEIYMIETANLYCKPAVSYSIKKWHVEGKIVIEVEVEKSQNLCYAKDESDKWIVYIRSHDQNIKANKVYIRYLKKKSTVKGIFLKYTDEEKKLLSYLAQNRDVSFTRLQRFSRLTYGKTENLLINLLCLDVIEMKMTERGAFYNLKKDVPTD